MDLAAKRIAMDVSMGMRRRKVTSHRPLKINFRCHICGDSHQNEFKTRGWIYERKGTMWYGCFNCGYQKPFISYLKEYHPEQFREYLLESRKDSVIEKKEEPDIEVFSKVIPVTKSTILDEFGKRMDLLPQGHPALTYMQNRLIPEDKMKLFWFTMNWKELANKISPNMYRKIEPEPRIVIPIYDENNDVSAIQGRALRSTESLRYMTVKVCEESNKIYGLERVNKNEDVFFLEGPIDSVFIDNALAIVGGNMALSDAPFKKNRVWVLDNEPRSVDTCKRIKKLIDAGERVVLWDAARWKSKDVNDMILKDGATIEKINLYLRKNIVHGLMAKHRFNNWCKVIIR